MGTLEHREGVEGPESAAESRLVFLFASLMGIAFFFLFEVLSWFTERGGIFSVFSAISSVHMNHHEISVDKSGLLFPTIVVSTITFLASCRIFNINIETSKIFSDVWTRVRAGFVTFAIIGGSFVVNGVLGESIITRYMMAHGYSRCVAGDWAQGNGKSSVWFANYVLANEDCREHQN